MYWFIVLIQFIFISPLTIIHHIIIIIHIVTLFFFRYISFIHIYLSTQPTPYLNLYIHIVGFTRYHRRSRRRQRSRSTSNIHRPNLQHDPSNTRRLQTINTQKDNRTRTLLLRNTCQSKTTQC